MNLPNWPYPFSTVRDLVINANYTNTMLYKQNEDYMYGTLKLGPNFKFWFIIQTNVITSMKLVHSDSSGVNQTLTIPATSEVFAHIYENFKPFFDYMSITASPTGLCPCP